VGWLGGPKNGQKVLPVRVAGREKKALPGLEKNHQKNRGRKKAPNGMSGGGQRRSRNTEKMGFPGKTSKTNDRGKKTEEATKYEIFWVKKKKVQDNRKKRQLDGGKTLLGGENKGPQGQ